MEYLENELDKINRYYRSKLINIITIPPIYNISPEQIPNYFSGIFMEATDTGIWAMCMIGDRKGKIDFYFHDKIIKIEEAGLIDINQLEEKDKEQIKNAIKKYEEKRKKEIEAYNKDTDAPDVKDPNDKEQVNDLLSQVQKLVLDNKTNKENSQGDFLVKRKKPD